MTSLYDLAPILLIPAGLVGIGFGLYRYFTSSIPSVQSTGDSEVTVRALTEEASSSQVTVQALRQTVTDLANTNITSLSTINDLLTSDHVEQAIGMVRLAETVNRAALTALDVIIQGYNPSHETPMANMAITDPRLIVIFSAFLLYIGSLILARNN
jgi:hypothetical protein